MATLATLLIEMGINTAPVTAGAAKVESSLAGMGASAKKFGGMVPIAAAAAGAAVVKFAFDAVSAASDLNESVNKVNVVFGSSAAEVEAWAKTTSTSFGISEQAALESAGTFGNLFDAMGLADSAGQEMSMTLVELAADLASFNNADPSDVLEAMQSGLTGQIRPLRQYGIEISEAALQQEALAEGITKSTSQMTMAEKVQLRYALILKQTGNAQGDFARTADGLANQQRILAAQWEDLKAALGTALLPVVLDVVEGFNNFATVLLFLTGQIEDFDAKVRNAAVGTGEFELKIASMFESVGSRIPIISQAIDLMHRLGGIFEQQDAVQTYQDHLERWAAALANGNPAVMQTIENTKNLARSFLGIPAPVSKAEEALRGLSKAGRGIAEGLAEEIPAIVGTVTKFKDAFNITPQEMTNIANNWEKIAKRIAHDLRVIGDSDLKPAMREAIAALPPEMRDAWVRGNDQQRHSIEQSIKNTYKVQDQMPALAKQALTGGQQVGGQMALGIARGINAGTPSIIAAAITAVAAAIAAARQAAEAKSPSKKMFLLGLDLMAGLQKGITDSQQQVIDAAQKVIDRAIKVMEKEIEGVQKKLDKVLGKASDLRGAVTGGMAGFGDISKFFDTVTFGSAANIIGGIQGQASEAQRFADILKALQAQGASANLLKQVASGGPEAIGFAQQLLQGGPAAIGQVNEALKTIQDLTEETAKGLSEAYFGEKIDKLQEELHGLREDLKILQHPQRLDAVVHGDDALRRWLLGVLRDSQLSRQGL